MSETATWISPRGGDWANGTNWNAGTIPGTGDIALIEGSIDFNVLVTGSQSVSGLVLDDDGAVLEVVGTFAIATTLEIDAGTLDLAGLLVGGVITSSGGSQIVTGSATLSDVVDDGSLVVASGASLFLDSPEGDALTALTNDGEVTFSSGGEEIANLDNTRGTLVIKPLTVLQIGSIGATMLPVALGDITVADAGRVYLLSTLDLGGQSLTTSQIPGHLSTLAVTDGTLSVDSGIANLGASDATIFANSETLSFLGMTQCLLVTGDASIEWLGAVTNCTIEGTVSSSLNVYGSLTVLDAAGGIGTIDAPIQFESDGVTFDNAVITGAPNIYIYGGGLVLGPDLLIECTDGQTGTISNGFFTNEGTIDVGSGLFLVSASAFTNTGDIIATGGDLDLLIEDVPFGFGIHGVFEPVLAATFRNDGVIQVSTLTALTLDAFVALTDLGTIEGTGATLVVAGTLPGSSSEFNQTLALAPATFDLGGGTLDIGADEPFAELDLQGVVENGVLVVTDGTIDFDGGALEDVTVVTPCFVAGTRIATVRGAAPVETLAPGDHVITRGGGVRPVVWLGTRRVVCGRHPNRALVDPVRIGRDAFSPGVPARELWLSPGHAVLVDGVLIPIGRLVNGSSIAQVEADEVIYWHVELDAHDVLFAEGLEAESYLDNGNRSAFANGGGIVQMHPDFAPDEHCEAVWEALGCAPLRVDGRVVARVAARLRRRAAVMQQTDPIGPDDLVALLRPAFYLSAYPDVARIGIDALTHYVGWGRSEGRLPCPEIELLRALGLVDPGTVAITMADVVSAGIDPVQHFSVTGWREGRRPNPYFDTAWYLDKHDVPADTNPLLHYVLLGESQGLQPSRHFDPAWYRHNYALDSTQSPLAHYLRHRRTQRFKPLPSFEVHAAVGAKDEALPHKRDPYLCSLIVGAHREGRQNLLF